MVVILLKFFEIIYLYWVLNVSLDLFNIDEFEFDLFDIYEVCVLLVDDSKLVRNYICWVLEGMGL